MLQPIIENSIIHGFKKKNRLEVHVEGTIQDNRICLIIKDNGQGISIDKLEDINRIILNKENSTNHQGIYNVYKRLYLVYEDELVFEIQSSTMGTEIKVSFPRGT